MRRRLILVAILAQFLVLALMAAQREYIREFGQRVYLRTAPIDPRDPFRGDFVRLSYAMNWVPAAQLREDSSATPARRGRGYRVYARLHPQPDGVAKYAGLSTVRPAHGLYLAGRTQTDWTQGRSTGLRVKYGIEQLFVQQGQGRVIEKQRGQRDGVQIPMEVEVAISGGTAVLRDYRWSRLGVQLQVLRAPAALRRGEPVDTEVALSPKLRMSLHNVSDTVLKLADPGTHCAFHLVSAGFRIESFQSSHQGCADAPFSEAITLAPGEHYAVDLDLQDPRWHVRVNDSEVSGEIGAVAQQERFRIVYRADTGADGEDPVWWRGEIASPSFNAGGQVD